MTGFIHAFIHKSANPLIKGRSIKQVPFFFNKLFNLLN